MDRILAAFGRMSRREQVLVGSLLGVLVFSVVGLALFLMGSAISDLEEQLAEDRASLEKLQGVPWDTAAASEGAPDNRPRECGEGCSTAPSA